MGIYEAIWASQFNQPVDEDLLKTFIARWCPNTNTVVTCYGELGISLWDVYRITGLPIVGEMYNEFFPPNKIIMSKKLPCSLRQLFQIWGRLYMGKARPKYTGE